MLCCAGACRTGRYIGAGSFFRASIVMGTKEYPEEEDYTAYLNKNGGSANAYTSDEDTVYFFDVNADHLGRG